MDNFLKERAEMDHSKQIEYTQQLMKGLVWTYVTVITLSYLILCKILPWFDNRRRLPSSEDEEILFEDFEPPRNDESQEANGVLLSSPVTKEECEEIQSSKPEEAVTDELREKLLKEKKEN